MKEYGKSKVSKLAVALVAAGGLYLCGTSEALAKKVIVRPGDRVVYRYPKNDRNYEWQRDQYDYRRYDWPSPARFGPPPWAASWYRSRHWRNEWRDSWRDGWRSHWRHRGDRD